MLFADKMWPKIGGKNGVAMTDFNNKDTNKYARIRHGDRKSKNT